MTVRGVRVRAAVDRAARIRRRLLVAAARQQAEDGRDYAQHQNEAGYANTDGEALLRDANTVLRALFAEDRIVVQSSLRKVIGFVDIESAVDLDGRRGSFAIIADLAVVRLST